MGQGHHSRSCGSLFTGRFADYLSFSIITRIAIIKVISCRGFVPIDHLARRNDIF
tara:strand:- start:3379 stop:3543 length:165 start_codon:yes stop_codon:yes gene_type:complete